MKRLQFEVPDEKVVDIDALVEKTGLKTRAQLFNVAYAFYNWAIRERENGRIIASVDEKQGKYKEVEMPGFPVMEEKIENISLDSLFAYLVPHIKTRQQMAAFTKLVDAFSEEEAQEGSPVPFFAGVEWQTALEEALQSSQLLMANQEWAEAGGSGQRLVVNVGPGGDILDAKPLELALANYSPIEYRKWRKAIQALQPDLPVNRVNK